MAVTTTWDFIDDTDGRVADAIKRLTKKSNGAKSTGRKEIWDLAYLFEYVDDQDINKMTKLTDLADSVILKLRGLTGWRSADVAGIYPKFSFDWTYDQDDNTKIRALRIRTYDTKSKKGQWSAYTTVPVLAEKYKHLCAVRAVQEFLRRWDRLQAPELEPNAPGRRTWQSQGQASPGVQEEGRLRALSRSNYFVQIQARLPGQCQDEEGR